MRIHSQSRAAMPSPNRQQRGLEGVSRRGKEFVHDPVQADDGGGFAFVEMAANRLANVCAELFPSVRLGDDGMAESTGDEATIGFVFYDVKNDLVHGLKLVG